MMACCSFSVIINYSLLLLFIYYHHCNSFFWLVRSVTYSRVKETTNNSLFLLQMTIISQTQFPSSLRNFFFKFSSNEKQKKNDKTLERFSRAKIFPYRRYKRREKKNETSDIKPERVVRRRARTRKSHFPCQRYEALALLILKLEFNISCAPCEGEIRRRIWLDVQTRFHSPGFPSRKTAVEGKPPRSRFLAVLYRIFIFYKTVRRFNRVSMTFYNLAGFTFERV